MSKIIFKANNICKSYGDNAIIKDANFELRKSEIVAIVGPNAGGKSTLLKILSGTIKPESGSVQFGDKTLNASSDFSKYIGYIPQANPLFEDMTVEDNLRFWASGRSGGYKELLNSNAIEQMKLEPYLKYKVSKLSGGLKKRVSIASVIYSKPEILILDEPGASLDVVFKEELKQFIVQYASNGGSVIIVSHEEGELSVASRMYLMSKPTLTLLDSPVTAGKLKDLISNE